MSDLSPVILDAAAVEALLPTVDTLAILRSMFLELAEGTAVQPPQSLSLFPEARATSSAIWAPWPGRASSA